MSYWPVVFIVLAIAMAVGPIMLMKPSRRDQRLAKLRQEAANTGLQIRMADYLKGKDKQAVAVYSLPVDLSNKTPCWVLLKRLYTHEIHFYGRWEWQADSQAIDTVKQQALKQFLDNLPEEIVGVEVNNKVIGLWWQEKPSGVTVKQVKDWINQCYTIISR